MVAPGNEQETTDMTPERWEKVRDVLGQVLELAPETRSPFLDDACANDPSLRSEVESLLSSDETARSSFLQSPPPVPAALTKGTRLGDYEIISLIGSGGMGEVYRARDTKLKRDVAIKVLPPYWSRDPERLQRFELEARAAAALNHPNITSIFHVGQHDGSPYIVTELLQGETLRKRLRKGPLRLREALDFGVEIARGLGAAHDAGVIHRDLKPENIFVTKDGRIKILDFGLAKLQVPKSAKPEDPTVIPRQTNPGQVLGTVGYMSPEQVRGQSTDARSDIFAAGAVLYEMLTGKPAFRKATSAETMSAILNEDPPPISQVVPNLPPGLQRIVNRCLVKSPEQRFQHASDVAFALEAMSDSSSATSHDVKETKSSKKWIWTAVSAAALAIAAAVIIWWGRPPAVPMVESVTQLTEDGIPKRGPLATDGSRIYFNEGAVGSWVIAQASAGGGEASIIPSKLANAHVAGISPDGSSLLALFGDNYPMPLWTIPLPTGEPRRLGSIQAQGASFFANGNLLFTRGTDVFVAESDGSNVYKLLTAPGEISCPSVSPDRRRIVFRISGEGRPDADFEAAADGSSFHEVARSAEGEEFGCPYWTPDGKYLISRVQRQGRSDIWAFLPRTRFSRGYREWTQLTNGPLSYNSPTPSPDGKRIFAIGNKLRGELVRYDRVTKQFVPFLGGISALHPTFSRDGQWVTYISYPDQTVWRSRPDGTERLQLTHPSLQASSPFISPDGTQVLFTGPGSQVFVIGMDGGSLRKIADKGEFGDTWSPDGNVVICTAGILPGGGVNQLEALDLRTGKRSVIPAAQEVFQGVWVTDDTLVAGTSDSTKLLTFNFKSGKWTELVSGNFVHWASSLDQKYLYYTTGGLEPKAMRIRLVDRKIEEIASLKDLRRAADQYTRYAYISVAPDGSPVFTRDIGTQEIYALTVKWP